MMDFILDNHEVTQQKENAKRNMILLAVIREIAITIENWTTSAKHAAKALLAKVPAKEMLELDLPSATIAS